MPDSHPRRKESFDDEAIIELTALITLQNFSSKFNAALDVFLQGFCASALPLEPDAPGATASNRGVI